MKIGLIGEYPTDIKAVAALLRKEFGNEIAILPMLLDIHGDNLNPEQKNEKGKVKRLLRQEFEWEKPDIVIFIRDLDATPLCEDYAEKMFRKKRYFTEYRSIVGKDKALFLLNIYELEALILANIEVFNKEYVADLQPVENIYWIKDPKGLLKTAGNKKYKQSDNPILFKLLEIDVLKANAPHLKLLLDKILRCIF